MYRKLRPLPSFVDTVLWIALISSLLLHRACPINEDDFDYCQWYDTERCPDYIESNYWKCLDEVCDYGKQYHCARHYTNRSKIIHACAESKECLPGEAPYLDNIKDGQPTDDFHVTCAECHDKEHYNDMKKNSSTYTECKQKTKCDPEHGIECNPVNKNSKDVYEKNRECRCNTFGNYVHELSHSTVCTKVNHIAKKCTHVGPCRNGTERVQNGTCVPECKQGHRTKHSDECIEDPDATDDPDTTTRSEVSRSTYSTTKNPNTSQSSLTFQTVISTGLSSVIQIGTTVTSSNSMPESGDLRKIIVAVIVSVVVTAVITAIVVIGICKRRELRSICRKLRNRAGGNRGRQGQDDENNAEPEERIELAGLREAGGNRGRQGRDDENNAIPEERMELAGLREAGGNRGRQGRDDENNAILEERMELAGLREAGGNRGRQGQDDENNAEPEELAGLREAGGNRGRQGQDDENNAEPEERIELAGLREEGPVPRRQGQDDRNDALEVQAGGNRGRQGQDDENNAEPEERIEVAGLREGRTSIETVLNLRKIKTVNLNYYGNENQTKDEYQRVGSEPTKPPRNQLAEIENERSKVSDVERELSGAQLDDLAVTVLRKCFTRLLDDLDSMETGDYLYQLEVISRRTNQDFSEMRHTKRCRNILDCVARERFKGYKVFTAIIKVTNPQLFEHLKKCETENVTTIKEET